MLIKRLKIKNFKKFNEEDFTFNDDMNIIVGDNENGKSSLLEAIEICLNFNYRGKPLNSELSVDLFNKECVKKYLSGNKSQSTLPEILIEAYLDGVPELNGHHNTEEEEAQGIFVRIYFDPDLSDSYSELIKSSEKILTLPIELYKAEWFSFSWNHLTYYNKRIHCLFIDPPRLHPTFGKTKYINNIINTALDKNSRAILNLNYRQLKSQFDTDKDVIKINKKLDSENIITDKSLKITTDVTSSKSWETNLELEVENVSFNHIGKGEQHQIQIKMAMQNQANDIHVIMIEEPENHLSHINLVKLVNYIDEKRNGKQIFLTTHSSYVLNKLNVSRLILLSRDSYTKLDKIDPTTIKTLKRLPGYDTLRVILSQKVILVEGPSDELILKKIYLDKYGVLPEERGIDIIVVRGIGFKTYLNIVNPIEHVVHVVKDNDGNYKKNIIDWKVGYEKCVKCFSPEDNLMNSLEPSLIEANGNKEDTLNKLAKAMLSSSAYKSYEQKTNLLEKKNYLKDYFVGEGSGAKKVSSAIRIFDNKNIKIIFPDYLTKAFEFDA